MSDRVQFLCCAIAKKIFLHPTWGITFINAGLHLDDARALGLKPLLMYGLAIPDTNIRYTNLSLLAEPLNVSDFLTEAWSNSESGLRGWPDELVVSATFAAANEVLINSLSIQGVKVTLPQRGSKKHSSLLRSAQDNVFDYGFRNNVLAKNVDLITDYNMSLNERLAFSTVIYEASVKYENTHAFLALPFRPWSGKLTCEMGWVNQEWLCSWGKTLPQVTKLWRKRFDEDRATWLFTQEPNDEDAIPIVLKTTPEPDWGADSEQHEMAMEFVESAKPLISCWPNRLAELAKDCNVTRQELDWCLKGRLQGKQSASITSGLAHRLNMSIDAHGYWSADGGNAYIANGLAQTQRCYEALSAGGDLEVSCEVLPSTGRADIAWRYLVFKTYNGRLNLMAFARGSREAALLDGDKLINLSDALHINESIYLDIVATMREASADVASNSHAMYVLEGKHGHFFYLLNYPGKNIF